MQDHQQWNIVIDKKDISNANIEISDIPELDEDQLLLKIEGFALTANNISYAGAGDKMGYWQFFPSEDSSNGIVPVWGYAEIIESANLEFEVGMRFYGFYPMGSHLIVTPNEGDSSGGFMDVSEHRAPMAPIYNYYRRLSDDSIDDMEALRAIMQPLFMTSFLIEHQFRGEQWFEAQNVVISSASSKTALALAYMVRNESPEIRRIGLTSSGNLDFTIESGLYDEVISYDDAFGEHGLDSEELMVSVDFSGNAQLLHNIHDHMGDNLKFSSLIGVTHVGEQSGLEEISGVKPVFFFAPAAAQEYVRNLGQAEFDSQAGRALYGFLDYISGQLDVRSVEGPQSIKIAYEQLLHGKVSASEGLYAVI